MTSPRTWTRRRLDPDERYGLRLTLVVLALLAGAVPFTLLALLVETSWAPLRELDTDVARSLHDWVVVRPDWQSLLRFLSDVLWDPVTFRLLVVGMSVWLWIRRARRLAVWAIVTMAASAALGALLKLVVARARPHLPNPVDTAPGWSFPSGHAMTGMTGSGVLLLALLPLVPRVWRPVAWVVAVVSALGVGYTRVALGVHYVSDVIGGWVLGLTVLAATSAVFEWWRRDAGLPGVDAARDGLEPEVDGDAADPEAPRAR